MDWIVRCLISGFEREEVLAPWSWSGFFYVSFLFFGVILIIFLIYFAAMQIRQFQSQSAEWHKFDLDVNHKRLSHEEVFCLRSKIHQLKYEHPAIILKNEVEFDRFVKKTLQSQNHHDELLLKAIREKIYEADKHFFLP